MTNKFLFKTPAILFAVAIMVLSSCSQYQKLLRSDDAMLKKQKAIEFYEKGDYTRSIGLLNSIIPVFRGTIHAENLNYYWAKAHFKMGDYVLAGSYFEAFVLGFPRSVHVEEFLFLSAYCKYLLSPRPSLDQTPTREAIAGFQRFINRFPNSPRVEEANNHIDELRLKLEIKVLESARLFFNIRDYTAAVRTFTNLIRDFPDTQYREEAMYMIMRSHYLHAVNSIEIRQLERYRNAVEAHRRLLSRFPESQFAESAQRILEDSQIQINRLEQAENLRKAQAQQEGTRAETNR